MSGKNENGRVVQFGHKLFEFNSFNHWINKTQSAFQQCGYPLEKTICVDAKNRICINGKDFKTARDEDAFPVSVYLYRWDR